MEGYGNSENVLARMSKEESALSQVPERYINLIKRTVAVGATNEELELFLYTASNLDLDPLMKEIVFFKAGRGGTGKPVLVVTRDGYLKTAMKNKNFEGMISFVVHENDQFEVDTQTFNVVHKFGVKDRGKIIGAWAKVEHSERKPIICFVNFEEYRKRGHQAWDQYPSAMIQKVAEVFALRRQFNIAGVTSDAEFEDANKLSKREQLEYKMEVIREEEERLAKEQLQEGNQTIEAEYTKKEENCETKSETVKEPVKEEPKEEEVKTPKKEPKKQPKKSTPKKSNKSKVKGTLNAPKDKPKEEPVKEEEPVEEPSVEEEAPEPVESKEPEFNLKDCDFSKIEDINKVLEFAGKEPNNKENILDSAKSLLKRGDVEVNVFAQMKRIAEGI